MFDYIIYTDEILCVCVCVWGGGGGGGGGGGYRVCIILIIDKMAAGKYFNCTRTKVLPEL